MRDLQIFVPSVPIISYSETSVLQTAQIHTIKTQLYFNVGLVLSFKLTALTVLIKLSVKYVILVLYYLKENA